LARLPHPFTAADRVGGYRYELSIAGSIVGAAQYAYCPNV
jgi:hypothetical protein